MADSNDRHYLMVDVVTPIPSDRIADAVKNSNRHKILVHAEAKLLASRGYWVLPIARLEKIFPEKQFNGNSASNNLKKVDEWFHPELGRYSGWNLAVACGFKEGKGLIVADADRHDQGDGVDEWQELVEQIEGLPEHPWATTPNDGEHHLFQWHPAFTRKSTKGNAGLEILGGKDGSLTAIALVYPSVVKTRKGEYGQYRWQVHPKDCLLPAIPVAIASHFSAAGYAGIGSGRGNERVRDSDVAPVIPIEQVKRMLESIDPDELSYDDWLRIGMAIHSQHPDAVTTWDGWSRRGARYQEGECTSRWKGFGTAGKSTLVTIGTLFYFAREAGWNSVEGDTQCNELSIRVAEFNQTYAHVIVGSQDRVLRLRPDHDVGELHYDLIAPAAFRRMFPGRFVTSPSGKSLPIADAWLNSPFRRSYQFGLRLAPNEQTREGVFNTWNGFAVQSKKGDCSLLLPHIRDVICAGNQDLYEWVLDWAADCVQDPGNLKGTAIVMRGKEGTGKGTFANTLGRLFGPHYVHLIDSSHLMGNFNAHLMEAIIVFADEITWGGNVKNQGKLKGLVTEPQLTGERKGIDAVQYRNFAHVIIASNAEWVIPAGSNSRRWLVLDVDDRHANDRKYFDAIHKQLNCGGYEAFLWELQHRKITSDLRYAPETAALVEQRRLSAATRDKFFEFIDHALSEGNWAIATIEHPDHGRCLDKQQVYVRYSQFVKDSGGVPLSDVSFWKQWLRVFPYSKAGLKEWPRSRSGSGFARLVVIRNRQKMCADFHKFYGTTSEDVLSTTGDWGDSDDRI